MANYTISPRQNPKPETRNPIFSTSFPYHSHVSFWMLINAPIYILSKDIKQSKALSSYFLNFYQPSTGSRLFRPILHCLYHSNSSPLGSQYSGLLNNPSSAHFPVIPSKIKSNMSCQTFPLSSPKITPLHSMNHTFSSCFLTKLIT